MNDPLYGGYIEFWFSKLDYEQIRCKEGIANAFLKQVDKLAEQFPDYDLIRVHIETRLIRDSSVSTVKGESNE